jgi:hypothetical protein
MPFADRSATGRGCIEPRCCGMKAESMKPCFEGLNLPSWDMSSQRGPRERRPLPPPFLPFSTQGTPMFSTARHPTMAISATSQGIWHRELRLRS